MFGLFSPSRVTFHSPTLGDKPLATRLVDQSFGVGQFVNGNVLGGWATDEARLPEEIPFGEFYTKEIEGDAGRVSVLELSPAPNLAGWNPFVAGVERVDGGGARKESWPLNEALALADVFQSGKTVDATIDFITKTDRVLGREGKNALFGPSHKNISHRCCKCKIPL